MAHKSIEEYLQKELEGKVFAWVHISYFNKFSIVRRYYAVLGGLVYEVTNGLKIATGDTVFNINKDCKKIGNYKPKNKYPMKSTSYTYQEFIKLIKLKPIKQ